MRTALFLFAGGCVLLQVAEAILEWSAGSSGEVGDDQTPSPAELCSTADAEGKTAFVFAKENVRWKVLLLWTISNGGVLLFSGLG